MADRRVANARPRLTERERDAIETRLNDAGMALLAIRRLAIDVGADGDQDGWYARAIQELARSTFKGVDACIGLIRHGPAIGNFESEFHDADGHTIDFTQDGDAGAEAANG